MRSLNSLPIGSQWSDEDAFVDSLLGFATDNDTFQTLCGGIHILDFLTREPDLYSTVLPEEWRTWAEPVDIDDFLDLLLRENTEPLYIHSGQDSNSAQLSTWRKYAVPPESLLRYIDAIRSHCLRREVKDTSQKDSESVTPMPRRLAIGMKPKKLHEVENFARFVYTLSKKVEDISGHRVSNVIDFGSGQNYLGRTLASPPYQMHVTAIERVHHNIKGAKGMDIYAKLAQKEKLMINKKEYKRQLKAEANDMASTIHERDIPPGLSRGKTMEQPPIAVIDVVPNGSKGSVTYLEHEIEDGYLENILQQNLTSLPSDGAAPAANALSQAPSTQSVLSNAQRLNLSNTERSTGRSSMVVSLHSCGNLIHHGLRSLCLNPSVSTVALIGCCYNLMTERLGPATYKLPVLRSLHPRLQITSEAYDPHGFPMSKRFEAYEHKSGRGIRLNITARMMAVQAPMNWGREDSQAFFTRHFYRALLQRILMDRGVVHQPDEPDSIVGGSLSGIDKIGTPLIVGSLRKSCFTSFAAYVHGALAKLVVHPDYGHVIREKTEDLTGEIIAEYERRYHFAKKNLSITWSLMAFSAAVVESMIVVDRWCFLEEQENVSHSWVEPVFDYAHSPRNLVVVGIKQARE